MWLVLDLHYPDSNEYPTETTFVEDSDEQNMRATDPPYEKLQINRTRPEPCDMEMDLYQLQAHNERAFNRKAADDCSR